MFKVTQYNTATDNIGTVIGGWESFSDILANSRLVDSKDSVEHFVGGTFNGTRIFSNLESMSCITLDLDHGNFTFEDIKNSADNYLNSTYVIYSTFSNSLNQTKARLVIPLDKPISGDQYSIISREIADDLGLMDFADSASFTANHLMLLPSHTELNKDIRYYAKGSKEILLMVRDVSASEIDSTKKATIIDTSKIDLVEFADVLSRYPNKDISYDRWLEVGMALYNHTGGLPEALQMWIDWSPDKSKTAVKEMQSKWGSVNGYSGGKVNIGTIIMRVKDIETVNAVREVVSNNSGSLVVNGDIAVSGTASNIIDLNATKRDMVIALMNKALEIRDFNEYDAFKTSIVKIPVGRITDDEYLLTASAIVKSPFGKQAGLTSAAIKKALMPAKKVRTIETVVISDDSPTVDEYGNLSKGDKPDWLADWVFIAERNTFYNTANHQEVNQQSFNTMFMEMPDLETEEGVVTPVVFARNNKKIMVVANKGFNPLEGRIYNDNPYKIIDSDYSSNEDRWMLNSYTKAGTTKHSISSLAVNDQEAAANYIQMFEEHLVKLAGNDSWILRDWLAHNVKFPGKKIRWALVLSGGFGTGKTYIKVVLAKLLGAKYVGDLTNELISGRFSSWVTGKLVNVVEEIKMTGHDKYDNINKLKAVISNDEASLEAKGYDAITVKNFTNYLMLTNILSGIPIDEDDRRYAVLSDSHKDLDNPLGIDFTKYATAEDYFNELYEGLDKYAHQLAYHLNELEFDPRFKPNGVAPATKSKAIMASLSKSTTHTLFWDAFEQFKCSVISDDIIDITHLKTSYNDTTPARDEQFPSPSAVKNLLMNAGYFELPKRIYIGPNTNHRAWKKARLTDDEVISTIKAFFTQDEI